MMKKPFVAFLLLGLISSNANAEIIDKSPYGFTSKHEFMVNKSPLVAYREFGKIANWWSSSHTWSGDAKNLSMQMRAGGCFCEKLKNNGSVKHMEVVYVKPNEEVRLFGALGPMQMSGATGHLVVKFIPNGTQTKIEAIFFVGGYAQGGIENWAAGVDSVLGEQFASLKQKIDWR